MDHSWIMMLVLGVGGLVSIITTLRLSIRSFFQNLWSRDRNAPPMVPKTRGAVIRWPRLDTLILRAAVRGKEPQLRQMIAYARGLASKRKLSVDFQLGVAEQLAFPDRSYDVVLCTWTVHHLPTDDQRRGLAEMARVLKPGGRLLLVDSHLDDLPLPQGAFSRMETGDIPFGKGFGFALERKNLARVTEKE